MSLNIENNIPLAPFTTYRVGGPARFFVRARKWEDILDAREFAKKEGVPMLIFGGGSNVLFADEGYPGLVVLNEMTQVDFDGETVTAEAGVGNPLWGASAAFAVTSTWRLRLKC